MNRSLKKRGRKGLEHYTLEEAAVKYMQTKK
jgi:hypothetical protein